MSTPPAPGSPEWMRLVTASKVAAILSLSPWESQRSMWHLMRGEIPGTDMTDAMKRGHKLENAVLDWWLDDNPDFTETARQPFYTLPDDEWGGATPDMRATDGERIVLVDAKTIGTDEGYGAAGTDEVPVYYLASSMWQLACAPEAHEVRLAVLFGKPFTFREYVIQRDDELIGSIIDRCREFHASLASDVPPPLDDSVATYDAIRKLHPDIDAKAEVELTADEAAEFITACAEADTAEKRAKAAKAAVLDRMKRARLATCQGVIVARRQPNKYGVSLVPVAKTIITGENAA